MADVENVQMEEIQLDFKTSKTEAPKTDYEEIKEVVKEVSREDIKENEIIKKEEFYAVGIALGTYIIAQNEKGMYLIDQHAAQERINYEKVLNALKNQNIYTTPLLLPIPIELTTSAFL